MPSVKPHVDVQNVVATASLEHDVDLDAVSRASLLDAEYRPEVFPGLVLRLRKPTVAVLIFHTGRMVCTGAKSEAQARKAVGRVALELRHAGIVVVGKPKAKIQNVVASGELGASVHLEQAAARLRRTLYEPDLFPGLIYHPTEGSGVTFLIFTSGKIVCTGARSEAEVHEALRNLTLKLQQEKLTLPQPHSHNATNDS